MINALVKQLQTLGHEQRLAVFRLLVRRFPEQVGAGDIASVLGLKASTLSDYLAALKASDLIKSTQVGTHVYYTVNLSGAEAMSAQLLGDCCRGRPDLCTPSAALQPHEGSQIPFSVLFICSANSARSIMAEAILNSLAPDRFQAFSAGTQAGAAVNPLVLELLQHKGHDISQLASKSIASFQGEAVPQFNFVFTVCDGAANEDCPPWPGQPINAHWSMADPAKAQGTEAEKRLAFQQAYGMLKNRLTVFAELPMEALSAVALQHAVDDIGRSQDPHKTIKEATS